jgi:uncharacterized membrane protein HdeD (DUF308 family)
MLKSLSTSLIVRGVLGVIIGILAIAWPGVTILALAIMFAIWVFIAAGLQATQAFSSDRVGPVAGHLLLALVDVVFGVLALAWPGVTIFALVLIVAFWALAGGFMELFAAFRSGEAAGTRALFIVGGLVSVLFGVVLVSRPGVGALTLALLFGFFNLMYGISGITMGIQLRQRSIHEPDRHEPVRS